MINLRSIIKILRPNNRDSEAKCFCKVQDCDGTFDLIDRGVCSVPLKQIVGSVGKCLDFDSQFKLKRHLPPDRVMRIKRAMLEGKLLPPIKLYKIKDEYYAMDGNHHLRPPRNWVDSISLQRLWSSFRLIIPAIFQSKVDRFRISESYHAICEASDICDL